jgi:hypothetical protein
MAIEVYKVIRGMEKGTSTANVPEECGLSNSSCSLDVDYGQRMSICGQVVLKCADFRVASNYRGPPASVFHLDYLFEPLEGS